MYLAYLPLPFYIASSLEPLCPKFVLVFDAGLMVHGVSVSMTFISNNGRSSKYIHAMLQFLYQTSTCLEAVSH